MPFVNEKEMLKNLLTPKEFEKCQLIAEGNYELYEDDSLNQKLFNLYWQGQLRGDMPYDVAKARSQTPDVWISRRLEEVFSE